MVLGYLSVLMACSPMLAGGVSTGKTYYVSMLGRDNATIASQNNSLLLIVYNKSPNSINVTITGSNCNGEGHHIMASTNTTAPIPISIDCPSLIPVGIEIAPKGLKVASDSDFILQVVQVDNSLSKAERSLEGYLAFESEHLGTEYYVITYCKTGGWCQFSVLATESTSLNIRFPRDVTATASCLTSSSTSSTVVSGTSVPFTLNALDVLHVESQQDLSGTYISSDKVVAVYAGARNVPVSNNTSGAAVREGHFVEQLLPSNKWGKEFVVVPNDLNKYGDLINIVTKSDATTVEILGFSPFVIPVAGDTTIRRIDWGMHTYVKADKPIAMAQFTFINLYNDVNRTELPGMVWVAAKNQMADEHFFYDYAGFRPSFSGVTLSVVALSNTTLKKKGIDPASAGDFFDASERTEIERSGSIAHHDQVSGYFRLEGDVANAYGYIAGNIALLGNIKTEDNEECVISSGYPGDRIDNDCDGQTDEDTCTVDDLSTTHYLPYDRTNSAAPIYTKVFDIGSQDTFYFRVVTCGLLQIGLRSTIYERSTSPTSKFAALQVSQSSILLESCSPNCDKDAVVPVVGITDCNTQFIDFKLTLVNDMMTVTAGSETGNVPITGLNVDRLLLMSLVRSSNVTMDTSTKDCGKIISGSEDNYGTDFVIPFHDQNDVSVDDSYLFVTNKKSVQATLDVVDKSGNNTSQITIAANDSKIVSQSEISADPSTHKFLRLRSDVEVSVQFMYVTKRTDSPHTTYTTAVALLPTDILGPYYHFKIGTNIRYLAVPVVENKVVKQKEGLFQIVGENESNLKTPQGTDTLLEANMPFVAFNGYKRRAFVQLQPKEHLGKHFYIPEIDLTLLGATGTISVITTEDSTYFKILGEYHEETIKDYKGAVFERDLYANELYEIEANKPVQVMLEIKANDDSWGSLLIVPHVNQYTEQTVFPKLDDTTKFSFKYSTGVEFDAVNMAASSYTPMTSLPVDAASRHLSRAGKMTYFLVFVTEVSSSRLFVLTSDLKFSSTSNTLCVLSPTTPGDNKDNDCDNLTDEETCTMHIVLGEIDPDIDGLINDDCKVNTAAFVNTAPLLALSSNTTTCPDPSDITTVAPTAPTPTTSQPVARLVHNKLNADWYSNLVYPPLKAKPPPPTFEPIESTFGATTQAPSTTAASGSTGSATTTPTAAAEETCMTDCVCPCGWVVEKNYTQEELKAVIVEIQEKLKISKTKLSSTLRKKTSAPDDRPSATAVGFAGFVFLIVTIGAMVLLDVSSIIRDLRMLRTNLQEVFNI